MKNFKHKVLCATVAALCAVPAANADDKLGVSGFLHLNANYIDVDSGDSVFTSGVEQAEIDLSYKLSDKLTAFADIEYDNGDPFTANQVDLEQAYVTYAASDSVTLKAGRFLSYTGWEAEEITGRMQASKSGYAALFYGYYQQGVSALYSGDSFSAAVSVVTDNGREAFLMADSVTDSGELVFDLQGSPTDYDAKDPAIETMLAFSPTNEITVKAFYTLDGDSNFFNAWAMYASGPITLAAEINSAEYGEPEHGLGEATGFLVMGNYKFDDTYALTIRYNDSEVEDNAGSEVGGSSVITIAPSMTFDSGAKAILEYRTDESDYAVDTSTLSLNAVFTF